MKAPRTPASSAASPSSGTASRGGGPAAALTTSARWTGPCAATGCHRRASAAPGDRSTTKTTPAGTRWTTRRLDAGSTMPVMESASPHQHQPGRLPLTPVAVGRLTSRSQRGERTSTRSTHASTGRSALRPAGVHLPGRPPSRDPGCACSSTPTWHGLPRRVSQQGSTEPVWPRWLRLASSNCCLVGGCSASTDWTPNGVRGRRLLGYRPPTERNPNGDRTGSTRHPNAHLA